MEVNLHLNQNVYDPSLTHEFSLTFVFGTIEGPFVMLRLIELSILLQAMTNSSPTIVCPVSHWRLKFKLNAILPLDAIGKSSQIQMLTSSHCVHWKGVHLKHPNTQSATCVLSEGA